MINQCTIWHEKYTNTNTSFIRSKPRSGFGNHSPPTCFNCLSQQGVGGLEGCTGLPALQPVPCLSGFCMGALYISILDL